MKIVPDRCLKPTREHAETTQTSSKVGMEPESLEPEGNGTN